MPVMQLLHKEHLIAHKALKSQDFFPFLKKGISSDDKNFTGS